ncbi:MAG: hypothetical protein QOF67_1275, partial [Mycobacterium sp.]|nr:hypothetical protein [Mycobacterium sp.]
RSGPFDVPREAANDPTALAMWLADQAVPNPDGLDATVAPYIADHWEIVAIQLAPAQAGESLTGDLQPLRLSFTSDKLVYPMRLSRSATTPQTVNLYVLADHRMDPKSVPVAGQKPSLQFAGHVERADVSPTLADYVGDGAFLTQWNDYIYQPELIDGDYVFEPAASDTPFQHVIYRTRDRGDVTGLILLAVLASCAMVLIVALARRRRRKASV